MQKKYALFHKVLKRFHDPAAFGLHKLIISERRENETKLLKERREALNVLQALIEQGDSNEIKARFDHMPDAWRKKVLNVLEASDSKDIIDILT